MFIITRNAKRFNNKHFTSYEEARSYVRKMIRKYLSLLNVKAQVGDHSGMTYSNPAITMYGYNITTK